MPWYAFTGASSFTADVPNAADAKAEARDTQTIAHGPYPTQAKAEAALGGKQPTVPQPGGGNGGTGIGSWWVVGTVGQINGKPGSPISIGTGGVSVGSPKAPGTGVEVIQATSQKLLQEFDQAKTLGLAAGPYPTKAAAQAALKSGVLPVAVQQSETGFNLEASGFADWFFRGLKILLGGILMILGLSRLTGAENIVTRTASKIKVIPV
jgi:hypothetical protein